VVERAAAAARGRAAAAEAEGDVVEQRLPRRTDVIARRSHHSRCRITGALLVALALGTLAVPLPAAAAQEAPRTFQTPEDAARELIRVVKAGNLEELIAIFGKDGRELAAGSDPAAARQNREVFTVAAAEGWHLVDQDRNRKILIVGNERWPFPIPLVSDGTAWHFDAAAGQAEVLARRIGRNELAAIETCRTYVTAQYHYAREGHDGKPAGIYAQDFRSERGKQNGLYWPVKRGEKRSPLGDLVAQAAEQELTVGTNVARPAPFHGYYFKILTGQGPSASGGASSYIVKGDMSEGFALVAWPAQYDAAGVMTFIVGRDGVVYQKDLGPDTQRIAKAMTRYNPDPSWHRVESESN
jgi:hypothetical protein